MIEGMDDLNNSQLILLAILVSFVSSIAVTIITISLLEETPVQVTQGVNRVIERTIERVVPEEENKEKEVIRETVVVNAEDQVVDAIKKVEGSVVRAFNSEGIELGIGTVVGTDGRVVMANVLLDATYRIKLHDGTTFEAKVVRVATNGLGLLTPTVPLSSGLTSVSFAKSIPQLGQTVVAIGGSGNNVVAIGRVGTFLYPEPDPTSTTTPSISDVTGILTDITDTSIKAGSPLVNLSGELVGIKGIEASFIPVSFIPREVSTSEVAEI